MEELVQSLLDNSKGPIDDAIFRLWVVQSLTKLETKIESLAEHKKDMESRLRELERLMWKAMGASVIVSSILSFIMAVALRFITK